MQGGVDHEGNVNARANIYWNKQGTNATKVQAQVSIAAGPSILTINHPQLSHTSMQNMVQLEQEYQGLDYSINLKALNPLPTDLTGIYIGKYLQSVTNNLGLGFETVYQRPAPGLSESITSYLLKYSGSKRDWIATAQVQPAGIIQTTLLAKAQREIRICGGPPDASYPCTKRCRGNSWGKIRLANGIVPSTIRLHWEGVGAFGAAVCSGVCISACWGDRPSQGMLEGT